ncbi:hypothetical protein DSECCO2_663610 [anaerobic digester metagenome]
MVGPALELFSCGQQLGRLGHELVVVAAVLLQLAHQVVGLHDVQGQQLLVEFQHFVVGAVQSGQRRLTLLPFGVLGVAAGQGRVGVGRFPVLFSNALDLGRNILTVLGREFDAQQGAQVRGKIRDAAFDAQQVFD